MTELAASAASRTPLALTGPKETRLGGSLRQAGPGSPLDHDA